MAQYDSSLEYFQKIKGANIPELYWNNYAKLLRNMGREENNIQNYQTALTFYQRELRIFPDKSPTDKGIIYNEIGFCYLEKAKLEHSLKLEASVKQEIDSANYYFAQANHSFEEEKSSILWTIRNYSGKGRTHLFNYQLFQNPDNLDKSVDYFAKILTLMPSLRKKLTTETSKSILTDLLYNAYEPALEANYALYKSNPTPENLQSAYNFIQSSKALALWEEMNRNQKDTTQKVDNQVKTADIQAKCKAENSAFIDYFQGKQSIFIFYTTPTQQGFLQKSISESDLQQQTDSLKFYMDSISNPNFKMARARYMEIGNELYKTVFSEIDSILSAEKIHKINLVLDGYLHKIPFDGLMYDLKKKKYLIEKYNIALNHSAAFWLQNSDNKRISADIVAFAPVFDYTFYKEYLPSKNKFERELPKTETTLNELDSMYEMKTYLRSQATKQQFLEVAEKYNIIHLATHGFADEAQSENSFIALAPDKAQDSVQKGHLDLMDIYGMKLRAQLALLTACETGKGLIKKGEGVISLARAFRYAGCERIIMTLWSVDERATMAITKDFYRNLAAGKCYGDALYEAKLAYLNGHRTSAMPSKWAGMVFIGNANGYCDLSSGANGYLTLMLRGIGLVCVALLGFVGWRWWKSRH
jgi:CHAT domain-containing protein